MKASDAMRTIEQVMPKAKIKANPQHRLLPDNETCDISVALNSFLVKRDGTNSWQTYASSNPKLNLVVSPYIEK
jgi:hypothetical protein